MTEIIPNLFLGDYKDSITLESDLVVNCTPDLPFHGKKKELRLPVRDNDDDSQQDILFSLLPNIIDAIDEALANNQRVLVHCRAGQQRSAAVVAAYLMSLQRCSAYEAITFIKSKRPLAFFNGVNFHRTLSEYERIV